jgi:hypothetical protein
MKTRITSFFPSLTFSSPFLTFLFPLFLTFLTLFVTNVATAQVPSYVPTNGLIGYWPFNGNANDVISATTPTLNSATQTTDRFGNTNSAYSFNGGQIIKYSGNSPLGQIGNSAQVFSINFWISGNLGNDNGVILGSFGWGYIVDVAGNKLHMQYVAPSGGIWQHAYSLSNINNGCWQMGTITKNGNTIKLYIDGQLNNTIVANYSFGSYNSTNCWFGSQGQDGGDFWTGKIDDIGLWNRELTQLEITNLFNLYNPILNFNAGNDVTACGTSTTLTAPTGYDSYVWSNGGTTNTTTVTANGTYTCTVTQGGCSVIDSLEVTLISLDAQVSSTSICAGAPVELTGSSNLSLNQNSNCIGNTGSPNPWPYPSAFDAGIIDLGNIGAQSVFSISTWVNAGATQNGISILLDASHGGSVNWVVQAFGNNTYTWGNLSFTLTPNVWQHVLLTYVNGSKKCYIDGQLVASVYNPISYSGSPQLYLGNWPEGGRRFNGLVDELYITYSELESANFTPSQVVSSPSANSFGLWHFDEGSNSSTLNSANGSTTQIGSWYWATRDVLSDAIISWNGVAGSPLQTVSPLVTTTYVSSVTMNSVTCSDSVTVVVNNPTINLGSDVTACGTFTTLTAPTGYDSYVWSNGGTTNTTTVSANGTYTCTVTQGGCSGSDSIDVTLIDATISATDSIICAGETTTLSVPQGGSSNTACSALPTNLQTGLVGYWPFCGNANDASGNGNTLNEYFVSYDSDRFGNSNASFFSNGIELGGGSSMTSNNPVFNIGQEEYTIGLWMKVANTSQVTRCLFNTIPHTGIGIAYNDNNAPGYVVYDIGPANAFWTNLYLHGPSNNYTPNDWHYVVVKKQGINYSQYIDGQLDHSYSNPAAANYNYDVNFRISGISPEYQIFHGNIDDVHIYNRALSAAEIVQHYNLTESDFSSVSYLWSTGATTPIIDVSPTSTTTYTCTVTANGVSCTDTITVVVGNPVASITPNGIVEICQGQSIALTGNGGVSYLWNTGAPTQSITVNTEAVYTVTVTDANGCTDTESQLVKVNQLPIIGVSNASICPGQSATLTATGGVSYAWSPATGLSATTGSTVTASPAASTLYTLTGTGANGCTNTASAAVTVNALPTATITPATTTTFCQGGSVVLNANTGAGLTYQWRLNGNPISGATSSSYTANASGSYTVVVTNASSCTSTSTATVVTVNALPTSTITPATATTFCQGGSVVLNANTGTGLSYQWRLNGNPISGATSSSYTANATGSYTVVVTNTLTCSATSTATVVTVNALPTANITPATATVFCQGGSVVLNANTGAGLSYQWFNNASVISGATSSSYTANASGSYTVVVTNTSTCSATSTATVVTVNALPTATITPATGTTFCQGGSVVLNANTGAGLSYQWRLNGNPISGATSSSYTANASGSYTVVVTIASACSSTSIATVVTVNALPTATITASSATTFCQGGSVVLTANTGAGLSYQWRLNGNPISGATSSSYTANASGSYTVVVTNASTCSSTSTATVVTVNALPTATITPATATTFCQGGSVVLNANTGAGLSYQWKLNGTNITGATSSSYTANTSGSYTVVVTNASSCSSTSTATVVTVNALPTATITPATATTFCQGGSVVLNANTGTGLTYQWKLNGANITGATSSSYTANASGSYTVVVTNASTCSSTSTATVVTVNALPTATITPATATTFCQGGSVVLNANTGAGLSYQWRLNGNPISGATSSSYTANASGSYTVVVTNASTCSSTSTATVITVNALPIATITPATATTFCQGGSVVLNANTGAGLTYQWFNNASAISGATSASYTANASGPYTVTVTNTSTCSSTSTATVVTVNALPIATITSATATTFCQGGSVVLNANTGAGLSYQWRLNGTNITGATSSSYTANASGSYTVVVTNASSCSSTSTATVVTVNALPTATITASSATTFCQGGSVVLTANTGTGLSYQWKLNGTNITGATSSSYTANASGSYTVVVTNASTCSSTSTATVVTVNALPTATITASSATTFCQGGSVLLNANTGTGLTYQWRLNGTNITGATSSSYTVNASGSYTVTVTNASTCSSTSTATVVTVNALPVASISPNGLVEICQGQSIALTANGGVSYLWSTGAPTQSITVSTEALYTVTVTDINGCTDTESQFVKVNQLPNVAVNNASICLGQSATLTATGGLSYVWSPATGLSATTGSTVSSSTTTTTVYTVTGTGANGCTNSATATVTVNALPTATITPATTTTFCQGGSVVLNANTGAGLSYQWFNNATAIAGATNSSYTATMSGSYTVVVTNASTCSSTSTAVVVTTIANVDYFADADGDGFGDVTTLISTCVQPQGYVTSSSDCNDNNAAIFPGAQEICNDIDDDCNQLIDDGLVFTTYYADVDGDSFGDLNNPLDACSVPNGYVTNNTDCNDNNVNQNAASAEICNGEDDDCDGTIDNGITFLDYYADADGDGFGAGDVISSCSDLGAGYVSNNTDCDDSNSNTNPSATEICNTIDDNCDGQIDEGVQTVYFIDNDGDTYGNPSVSILACTQPIGYTPDDSDCNDNNASINPGAEDIAGNGIDENCDGQIDNSIFELNATINLYPNPTRSELNIQISNALVGNEMYIFDAVGKLVYKQQLLSTQTNVSVSNLADGNYIVRVGELVKRFEVIK